MCEKCEKLTAEVERLRARVEREQLFEQMVDQHVADRQPVYVRLVDKDYLPRAIPVGQDRYNVLFEIDQSVGNLPARSVLVVRKSAIVYYAIIPGTTSTEQRMVAVPTLTVEP